MDKEDFHEAKELNKFFFKVFLILVVGCIIFGIFWNSKFPNDSKSQLQFSQFFGLIILGALIIMFAVYKSRQKIRKE